MSRQQKHEARNAAARPVCIIFFFSPSLSSGALLGDDTGPTLNRKWKEHFLSDSYFDGLLLPLCWLNMSERQAASSVHPHLQGESPMSLKPSRTCDPASPGSCGAVSVDVKHFEWLKASL